MNSNKDEPSEKTVCFLFKLVSLVKKHKSRYSASSDLVNLCSFFIIWLNQFYFSAFVTFHESSLAITSVYFVAVCIPVSVIRMLAKKRSIKSLTLHLSFIQTALGWSVVPRLEMRITSFLFLIFCGFPIEKQVLTS